MTTNDLDRYEISFEYKVCLIKKLIGRPNDALFSSKISLLPALRHLPMVTFTTRETKEQKGVCSKAIEIHQLS